MSLGHPDACPPVIARAFREYRDNHYEPGGFVMRVLENDLKGALGSADHANLALLPHIVAYAMECLPGTAWGSPEAVEGWLHEYTCDGCEQVCRGSPAKTETRHGHTLVRGVEVEVEADVVLCPACVT